MDVLTAIRNRRSVRSFSPLPIPAAVLARLREALRSAPSACNLQPWHFVLVTEPDLRRRVAQACSDQLWMADAPLIIVACGLTEEAYGRMGGTRSSLDIDVAIALDHLMLAAVAEGVGTCWIGAFDEDAVRNLLAIPAAVEVVALTPVGFPSAPDLIAPLADNRRKPVSQLFSRDRYGDTAKP
jgi:nitroreductase